MSNDPKIDTPPDTSSLDSLPDKASVAPAPAAGDAGNGGKKKAPAEAAPAPTPRRRGSHKTPPDNNGSESASDTKAGDASPPVAAPSDAGNGSKRRRTRTQTTAVSAPKPRRRGGYKTPPVDKQFKPGQSGNPSGRRKKPQFPRHIGNQIEGITGAIIAELNHIMMHGIPKGMPTGRYAGARLYARTFYKDATTKDGYARKRLYALYHEDRQNLDIFRARDKSAAGAEELSMMIKAVMDPTVTEEEFEEIFDKLEEGKRERYGLD